MRTWWRARKMIRAVEGGDRVEREKMLEAMRAAVARLERELEVTS